MKRIAAIRLVGGGEIKVIHQPAVEQQVNFIRVPVHRPDVKLLRPIITAEFCGRFSRRRPDRFSVETVSDVGEHHVPVILHDVHLAARRPAHPGRGAECPERRPASAARVNPRAHLELAISELAQTMRADTGRSVFNPLAARLPIRAVRDEVGIGFVILAPRLDDEQAVCAKGVFRLIPLQFVVAHEAALIIPVRRIRRAVRVEFIGPDQFPIVGRISRGQRNGIRLGAMGGEGEK